jgi:hypothetical protein
MTDKDINHKANSLAKKHVDKLRKQIEELKQEARDIYIRSNMNVPDWCKDE